MLRTVVGAVLLLIAMSATHCSERNRGTYWRVKGDFERAAKQPLASFLVDPTSTEPIALNVECWYVFAHRIVVYAEGLAEPHDPPERIAIRANVSVRDSEGVSDFQSTEESSVDWGAGHRRAGDLIASFRVYSLGNVHVEYRPTEAIAPSATPASPVRISVYLGVCGCELLVAAVAGAFMAAQTAVVLAALPAAAIAFGLRRHMRA